MHDGTSVKSEQPEAIDVLVVGAGPVGCVIAERVASQLGWTVQIVDRRDHIAGNCYDRKTESGVLVHQYGPHYFRTNSKSLIEYLSKFTEWIPGKYIVKTSVDGKLYPFPINLTTLEMFFDRDLNEASAVDLLNEVRDDIDRPDNSEEFVLSRVGRAMYEKFYLGYTLKQWGRHPRELDSSVCGRIPVRMNRDDRYVDHRYQLMPAEGYTQMFKKMIDHPLIGVSLGQDYRAAKAAYAPRRATVYCGPVDEYFDYKLGPLPWRSLKFEFKEYDVEQRQECVQINYPNEHEYTRSVEFKHVTGQVHPRTAVSFETPQEHGEPYYPVPSNDNARLYTEYEQLALEERARANVFFVGRLARYKYLNMDEAIESALATFAEVKEL